MQSSKRIIQLQNLRVF